MSATRGMPLAAVKPGSRVRVCAVSGRDGQAQRLRELGLLEGKTIRVVTNTDPLICQVGECRFGMCHRLARCVIVEPLPSEHARSA